MSSFAYSLARTHVRMQAWGAYRAFLITVDIAHEAIKKTGGATPAVPLPRLEFLLNAPRNTTRPASGGASSAVSSSLITPLLPIIHTGFGRLFLHMQCLFQYMAAVCADFGADKRPMLQLLWCQADPLGPILLRRLLWVRSWSQMWA